MHGRNRGWHACACIAACLAGAMPASPALAYFDHYLSGTIVGTLSQDQLAAATDIFRQALEQSADGARTSFTLPPDKRNRNIDGALTPLRTVQDHGTPCRQIRTELRRLGESEMWTGWYCKEKDGNWKWRKLQQ